MITISSEILFYFLHGDDIAEIARNINFPHNYGIIMKHKVRDIGDKPQTQNDNG